MKFKGFSFALLLTFIFNQTAQAQHAVARLWMEAQLAGIRRNFAKPTVHARNLFHVSLAMYDAWAAYDSVAKPFLLGNTVGGFNSPFTGVPAPADLHAAREEAISYAAYRVLTWRYTNRFNPACPNAPLNRPLNDTVTLKNFDALFLSLGYDSSYHGTNYASGNPADLGNYVAEQVIAFGWQDGANEPCGYSNQYYVPVNPPLVVKRPGNPDIIDPNRFQPLALDFFIDQNGQLIPGGVQDFLSPEWGNVTPFALNDSAKTVYTRYGDNYNVYEDPGPPPYIDTVNGGGLNDIFKWTHSLVTVWSAHLDPTDGVMWDISPNRIGNVQSYPTDYADHPAFYDLFNGGDHGIGYTVNPKTGQPYAEQWVPRGDYARVLAEFWADGPSSETPPGHWFTILNYVHDHPQFARRWGGKGPVMDDLEWYVKAYLTLGGAVHDAAICAWGAKGAYDYVRPVSSLRYMAAHGQSSDTTLPNYSPKGLPLIPGYIEVIQPGDPLDTNGMHAGQIKVKAWRGFNFFYSVPPGNPATEVAGVGWILASQWMPYQRPTFVTPPFAGYISGHSTYSRTAAEVMERLTGDEYFPGGMGEFHAAQNQYLVFEDGPSVDVTLQWAKYKDASDQCSLSRIWGGIHPPADDIPGRLAGMKIGPAAFNHAQSYFDSKKPRAVSVIPSTNIISDPNVGISTFALKVTFSENMDTAITPQITFPVENPLAKTLAFNSGRWMGWTAYQVSYNVADSSEILSDIDVGVSGAKDLAGNEQAPFVAADIFSINTVDPAVMSVIANPFIVADANTGTGAFTLTIRFNDDMNTSVAPQISFPIENPLANTLSFNPVISRWVNSSAYAAKYDVADAGEELSNIDVRIAGAVNMTGNEQVPFLAADKFSIDTKNPEVISLTPVKTLITASDVGIASFSMTAVFSEPMDTAVKFPVTFPSENPSATLIYNPGVSKWVSRTEYIAQYDVLGSSQILSNIDVEITSPCTDLSGNVHLAYSATNKFSIDMTTAAMDLKQESPLSIYPNPSNGTLNVKLKGLTSEAKIELFNILGKPVYSAKADKAAEQFQLNISEIPVGMYLIRISATDWVKSAKVQIE